MLVKSENQESIAAQPAAAKYTDHTNVECFILQLQLGQDYWKKTDKSDTRRT